MIENEDRAAEDVQPPSANDNASGAARPQIGAAILRKGRCLLRAYAEETNRLNRERRADGDADRKALADVEKKLKEIVTAIEDGGYCRHPRWPASASWKQSRRS